MSEWSGLAERLRLVDPAAFEELLVELRALVESCERAAQVGPIDLRPVKPACPDRIILAPPRSRISQ
jgi:hypothetical protein